MKNYLHIENKSVPWLFLLVAVPIIVAALDQFNVINLTPFLASVMILFMSIFVFIELGFKAKVKGFKLGNKPFRMFGLLVLVLAVLMAVLNLVGLYFPLFETIQGIISILLSLYVIIVAFTK
jgi:hypothetical protein